MDQWLCIEQAFLQPAMQKVIARKGAEGFGKEDPGPAVVEEGRSELATTLDVMARHLSSRSYLAGERFSLADLVWLAYFPYAQDAGAGDLIAARARISDWWRRVQDRPSLATALNKLGVKPG